MAQNQETYVKLIIEHLKHDAVILSFRGKYLVTAKWMDTGYYINHDLYRQLITQVDLCSKILKDHFGNSFTIEYFINS